MSVDTLRAANAAGKAIDAFWAAVAAEYPEITTGDLDPYTVAGFRGTCNSIVAEWVSANTPVPDTDDEDSEAVDNLAEMLGHEACAYTLHATTEEIAMHLAHVSAGNTEACDR